ncbi:MAG: ABC transporter ATP-binding protein [Anaerolineae bacterium]|nr:ABC transporter ATP-binding protein [Anaerolineae bacterium]
MATTDIVIATRHFTRRFGDLVAVNNLTLEVFRGEIFGLLGHNGAGKTTTIRLLNGVLAANSGSARVLGFDPSKDGTALRRRTGVLTENPSLDDRLTARENLLFYADINNVPRGKAPRRIEELLVDFELLERADEQAGGYSKGMKQRLALARALLHEPELLFLDEPTTGLDPVASLYVRQLITHLSKHKGRTVLLCTHNLVEAQRLCDRVAVLEHGQLLAVGTPADLGHRFGKVHKLAVELEHEQVPQALEILKQEQGITVEAEDKVLHIIGAVRERIPALIQLLTNAHIRIYRVTPQEPSLEDVYFALHGEGENSL